MAEISRLPFIDRLPQTEEERIQAEAVLLEEMKKLSMEEHEKILFEIHGISTNDQLDDEDDSSDTDGMGESKSEDRKAALNARLEELKRELEKIPPAEKQAFLVALAQNQDYVLNRNFLRMFLRSKEYNCKEAAALLVRHFDVKRGLFGSGPVLARDIYLADLTAEDRLALESGVAQVSPSRDAAGRMIHYMSPFSVEVKSKTDESKHRAAWYQIMTFLKDPESSRKGVVQVVYNFGDRHGSVDMIKKLQRIGQALPHRVVALHYCYNSAKVLRALTGFQLLVFNDTRRFRLRKHCGDLATMHFELQTFGIPVQDSPMQDDGTWDVKRHLAWIRMQEQREQEILSASKDSSFTRKDNSVLVPRKFDVLFGKDKTAMSHPGNLRCLHIVEMHREMYEDADRREKTKVADRVIQIIYDSQGRFLKKDKRGWEVVNHSVAREKVSHFFRSLREKRNSGSSGNAGSCPKRRASDGSAATSASNSSFSSEFKVLKREC